MKKKTVITVVIGVIIALTIITSIYGKNPIYNYVKNKYFPDVLNLEEDASKAGYSEYQLGTVVSLKVNGLKDEEFETTDVYQWLWISIFLRVINQQAI